MVEVVWIMYDNKKKEAEIPYFTIGGLYFWHSWSFQADKII